MEVIIKEETTPSSLSKQAECQPRLAECCVGRLLTQQDGAKRHKHVMGQTMSK